MINVNNLKPGITFESEGQIYQVLEAQHSKQGRAQANVKIKAKNLRTQAIIVKTFNGGDKVDPAFIEKKEVSFLYQDHDFVVFMDQESYEQINLPIKKVEWELNFLKASTLAELKMFKQEVLGIELPSHIELIVKSAPDAVKGNTQSNPQKKVVLETNYTLETPMFIKVGDVVIVDSKSGKYIGKGK